MNPQPSPVGLELRTYAHEISLDPAAPIDDLAPLRDIVGDARVVVLGESVHGVPAFWQMRHRVMQFLATELGFTGLVTESGLPEGLSDQSGLPGELERDPSIPGVRHYGMDLAGSAAAYRGPGLSLALAYLNSIDAEAGATLRTKFDELLALLGDGAMNLSAYLAAPMDQRNELTAVIADLVALLVSESHRYAERSSYDSLQLALRAAISARQADDHIRATAVGRPPLRDAAMSENVQWILTREQRILVHAHNVHIQRWPHALLGAPVTTLGQYLADALDPSDVVVIGTSFTSGRMQSVSGEAMELIGKVFTGEISVEDLVAATPLVDIGPPPAGTVDAILAQAELPAFVVHLRQLPATGELAKAMDSAHSLRTNNLALEVPVRTAFDAILHIDRIEQRPPNVAEMTQALSAMQSAMS